MNIEPTYTSVGELFRYRPMFFIPKYQRSYSWEDESIDDFLGDLEYAYSKRKAGNEINHFFGGVLSVKHSVVGVVNQHEYELIDGQQRIATFNLLSACIIKKYKHLLPNLEEDNEQIVRDRIDTLSERFISFRQEVQRTAQNVNVLELSRSDNDFFRSLLRGENPNFDDRYSHKNIQKAHNKIEEKINSLVDDDSIEEIIDNLELMTQVIDIDFTILHMVTENKSDAYRLFQVLNDRGTSLTDGDLLRAKTLEIVEGYDAQQNDIEKLWDDILCDIPSKTANYLKWIYESYKGKSPKTSLLYDQYLDHFFPLHANNELNLEQAKKVYKDVFLTKEDIQLCKQIKEGLWPYEHQDPITPWDRSRLEVLLVDLDHELAIPLILAASKLDHRKFSKIVQMIERTFFRYKIICNQHSGPLKKIYFDAALSIRNNPADYDEEDLRQDLKELIDNKAPNDRFQHSLTSLEYKTRASNKHLKYFLLTTEYYYRWYKNGGNGEPICFDKTRLYSFSGTSIEHMYPRNASQDVMNHDLEELKNTLGNLTIMDPTQNNIGDNYPFVEKKHLYENSTSDLTKEIGEKGSWEVAEIEWHKNNLISAALKIFIP